MRRVAAVLTLTAGAAAAAAAVACGPSYQAIYEGDARFEHCYAVDENPSVSMKVKEECWNEWLDHYTYGQTRDRVVYAYNRARAMNRVVEIPTDEALMGAAPGEVPRSGGITAPAPTSAFAPPPKTLDVGDGGVGGTSAAAGGTAPQANWMNNLPPPPPPPSLDGGGGGGGGGAGAQHTQQQPPPGYAPSLNERPPGAACAEDCIMAWRSCRSTCDAGAKCDRCDKGYKGCLRGCSAK